MRLLLNWTAQSWSDMAPRQRTRAAYTAWLACLLIGLIGTAVFSWQSHSSYRALLAADAALRQRQVISESQARSSPAVGDSQDYTHTLPVTAPTDAEFRFASKLAREHGVRIVRMQAESLSGDSQRLAKIRLSIQLRGDYQDIKAVWTSMLEQFPGLALQRLAVKQRGAADAAEVDRGNEEATLDLVQYTRPAQAS